jgi:predicted dehydrogenase
MTSGINPLTYVVIGAGASVFNMHRPALQTENVRVIAVCDINEETGRPVAAEFGCPFYADYRQMLAETRSDVAVIMTPHPLHAPMAIDAMRAGRHVLTEKPMAVAVSEADEMIACAQETGRLLAVNFQQRFRPAVERARELVAAGEIGPLVRTVSIEPWYRTAFYYRTAGWRAKWTSEGGGVLLNQAPHTLDILCHLAGLPAKVWGWARTRYHAIEVEDTAQAMFEYPNGAPGYLTVSTVEWGVQPRLQVIGERGALELMGNQLTLRRFTPSLAEFMFTSDRMFATPATTGETNDMPDTSGGHKAVYRDLDAAIREGRQPRANGPEGRMSLELANAIILSSCLRRPVRLPLDRAAYSTLLADLAAGRRKLKR